MSESLRALQRSPRINKLTEEFRRCRSDRSATVRVIQHNEIAILGIDDHRSRLLTDQKSAQIVPRPVSVPRTVDVAVHDTAGHRAQIEGARTE